MQRLRSAQNVSPMRSWVDFEWISGQPTRREYPSGQQQPLSHEPDLDACVVWRKIPLHSTNPRPRGSSLASPPLLVLFFPHRQITRLTTGAASDVVPVLILIMRIWSRGARRSLAVPSFGSPRGISRLDSFLPAFSFRIRNSRKQWPIASASRLIIMMSSPLYLFFSLLTLRFQFVFR